MASTRHERLKNSGFKKVDVSMAAVSLIFDLRTEKSIRGSPEYFAYKKVTPWLIPKPYGSRNCGVLLLFTHIIY